MSGFRIDSRTYDLLLSEEAMGGSSAFNGFTETGIPEPPAHRRCFRNPSDESLILVNGIVPLMKYAGAFATIATAARLAVTLTLLSRSAQAQTSILDFRSQESRPAFGCIDSLT